MKFKDINDIILEEIKITLDKVDESEFKELINTIINSKKVFVIGVGRVLLMLKAFAKRLNHVGIKSYVVGETTIPGIDSKDLLVAASGSGETITTLTIMKLAKKYKAKIALITAASNSKAKKKCDISLTIPANTKLNLPGETKSKQPMTNLFEQCLLILCDAVTISIQKRLSITEEDLWKVHANLE